MAQDPKSVVEELFRRIEADDLSAIDDLMAEEMVNHAAPGRPAREGWKQILSIIKTDFRCGFHHRTPPPLRRR